MSHSTVTVASLPKGFVLRWRALVAALAIFAAAGSAMAAQASDPVAAASSQPAAAPAKTDVDHRVIKPGDRGCLRHTGSLIPPAKGDCLPVAGRSYSGDELRNTGAMDTARALQMLDPSITAGH